VANDLQVKHVRVSIEALKTTRAGAFCERGYAGVGVVQIGEGRRQPDGHHSSVHVAFIKPPRTFRGLRIRDSKGLAQSLLPD
jgi:hypothetical protein